MRLGLLGYPIEHSKSPDLYRRFLGSSLSSYDMFSFEKEDMIPSLNFFSERLDGLNITSPYKRHFVPNVLIPSEMVASLGVINTLAFVENKTIATNTDLEAVVEILKNYQKKFGQIKILLLGDGAMAEVTKIVAENLNIPLVQFSRKLHPKFDKIDLTIFEESKVQSIIINSCSRSYTFNGKTSGSEIFWDYNYSFKPHQELLPSRVKLYHDGQSLLELQAKAAIKFWAQHTSKLT